MSRADITRTMVPFCRRVKVICSRQFWAVFPNALKRCGAMPCIPDNDQGIVEEDTFRLGLTDVMLIRALAAVAIVPVKTRDLVNIDHICICSIHTRRGVNATWILIRALKSCAGWAGIPLSRAG